MQYKMPLTERDLNIPFRTSRSSASLPPSPANYETKLHSRLPIPCATKTDSPSTAKWMAGTPSTLNSPVPTAHRARQSPGNRQSSTLSIFSRQSKSPASNRTITTADKPLPTPPIARLSTASSPTKQSRSLIDASENPLHLTSTTGSKHEWPSLKPLNSDLSSLSRSPTPLADSSPNETCKELCDCPRSIMRSEPKAEDSLQQRTDHDRGENMTTVKKGCSSAISRPSTPCSHRMPTDNGLPFGASRDHGPIELGGDALHYANDSHQYEHRRSNSPGPPQDLGGSSVRVDMVASRLSSPFISTYIDPPSPSPTSSFPQDSSPANFSRPRLTTVATPSPTPKMRTASRIPIADNHSLKPTLINVKDCRNSDVGAEEFGARPANCPSYGTRRLDAPDALQILDQGIKRRQKQRDLHCESKSRLRRTPTGDSVRATATSLKSSSDKTSLSNDQPKRLSSEPGSAARSTSDEDEYSAAKEHPAPYASSQSLPGQHRVHDTKRDTERRLPSYYFSPDRGTLRNTRPPTSSPFTTPLPTIPSNASFDVDAYRENEEITLELTRTLSQLEGRGSPPKSVDVDDNALFRMFGRLTQGVSPENDGSLSDDAAAAQRFIAVGDREKPSDHQTKSTNPENHCISENTVNSATSMIDPTPRANIKDRIKNEFPNTTVSIDGQTSIPLVNGILSHSISGSSTMTVLPRAHPNQTLPPQESEATQNHSSTQQIWREIELTSKASTGYPTCPSSERAGDSVNEEANAGRSVPKCRSSPLLGGHHNKSVGHATGNLVRGGYTKSTISSSSRRSPRNFSYSTDVATSLPSITPETRKTNVARDQFEANKATGLKQSHSRSRYVLRKINGLISGRRDKKNIEAATVLASEVDTGLTASCSQATPADNSRKRTEDARFPDISESQSSVHPSLRSKPHTALEKTTSSGEDGLHLRDRNTPNAVQTLSDQLADKATWEVDPARKARLLSFAKVLSDSVISAHEARISAETAKQAAESAQTAYEMTRKGLDLLQRLATSFHQGQ